MLNRRDLLVTGASGLLLAFLRRADAAELGNFHAVYDDPAERERFFLFLVNIFHLYPEEAFQKLIIAEVAKSSDDRAIYEGIQSGLSAIKPTGAEVTYSLPALRKQKAEMARQAAVHLKDLKTIDGYVEIGSLGRYVGPLAKAAPIRGDIVVVNDLAPGYGPADVLERGSLAKHFRFAQLGDYDPFGTSLLADHSVDLVSNFIGFHHCPVDRLDGFIAGIHRVLRPGGRLLLREHDVVDTRMDRFVALAHDVFNAGVSLTWADNHAQLRGFRSCDAWAALLAERGFRAVGDRLLQDGDPTDNRLLCFQKA